MTEYARLHSQESEQAVLGALLRAPDKSDELDGLRPEHFYTEAHRIIFETILSMLAAGHPVDAITVAEALEDAGRGEVSGGLAYLGQLVSDTPGQNVRHYATTVRNKALERQLLGAADTIRTTVEGPGSTIEKLGKAQAAVMAITERAELRKPRLIGEVLNDSVALIEKRGSGEAAGLPTGFEDVDARMCGGMREGNMIVVAGRPGSGKTTFAVNIGYSVASIQCVPVAVFSMEMADVELADRLIAQAGQVALDRVLAGDMNGESGERIMAGIGKLMNLPFVIDEQGGLSLFELASKARSIKRQFPDLGLIVIDYLQLMCGAGEENRVQEISTISRGIKSLAKELRTPIIALSQLNRGVENRPNKRPVMADLRESGAIEQDADAILFVYRDEIYNPDTPDKGTAEIIIGKLRQGEPGTVRLGFQGEYSRFVSLARSWEGN